MAHAGQQAHHDLLRRQRQTGGDLGGALAGIAQSVVGAGASTTRETAGGQTSAAQGTSVPAQQSTMSAAAPTTQQTSAAAPSSSSSTVQEVTHSTTTSAAPVPSSTTSEPVQQSTTTTAISSSTTTQAVATSSTTTSSSTTTTAASSSSILSLSSASAFTTVVVVPASSSTFSSSASAATVSRPASNAAQSGSSVSTGTVVGIVIGALAGVGVLACAVVWLFKKKFNRDDDDQVSPFDRDEFRRASVMLDDVDEHYVSQSLNSYRNVATGGSAGGPGSISGGHSPQMSEYSMHDMMDNGALARSGTLMSSTGTAAALPGLARGNTLSAPRPPTMISHHFQHQQQQQGVMPSFQPGQVVPGMPSPPPPSYHTGYGGSGAIDLYGATGGAGPYGAIPHPANGLAPYPIAAGGLDRSLSTASAGPWHGTRAGPGADLSRANSQASAYSQMSDGAQAGSSLPASLRPGGSSHGHGGPGAGAGAYDERPLSLVHEHDEPYSSSNPTFDRARQAEAGAELSRSGTPVNHNVQQTFFSHSAAGHVREESLDAFGARKGAADRGVEQSAIVGRWSDGEEFADDGASVKRERRLSIRNGGLDQFDEDDADVYGGTR
ncbi:hypothetical protein Rt10032_c03g1713 [Rhodotorula toruloides]|uniref:Uncharacterized protein n=1 Tax=Rhodotorula toruloides TaxID=5286 RepID=A0A511KCN0_RHOTO|nr:hypothetical protein Rt10032_c03g1713 [Rhodotorula toruloides]